MVDLYERLAGVGFPEEYVRERILPDWWDDELADYPFNRRVAELAISRSLDIPLNQLAGADLPLSLRAEQEVRFKHWNNVDRASLRPAVTLAKRMAELTVAAATKLEPCAAEGITAEKLRQTILLKHPHVSLANLLTATWNLGVPVVYLSEIPSKRVDGMAFAVGDRPCIALASNRSAPAWLLWHLAHELGHIALRHLTGGGALDVEITESGDDEEVQANQFAFSLVHGNEGEIDFSGVKSHFDLIRLGQDLGRKRNVAPECIVTHFGFKTGGWSLMGLALKTMKADSGAQLQVRAEIMRRTNDLRRLTETDKHFFCQVAEIIPG